MHPYPHLYKVSAAGTPAGSIPVDSAGLPTLVTAAPPEFDGPGGIWSPETLLCASIADCLILTFRSVSRASKFEWAKLDCRVEGTLERVEGVTQFTRYVTYATLTVPPGTDHARARALLEKSEHVCLIANSLRGERVLEANIVEDGTPA